MIGLMKKALLFGAAALAIALVAWPRGEKALDRPDDTLAYDRLWIDHMPTSQTEFVDILFMSTETKPRLGVFQHTSVWRGAYEVFVHERLGDGRLRLTYPQSRKSDEVTLRARRCDEKGFDYCLEVRGAAHGVGRYYSQRDWGRRDDLRRLEAQTRRLVTTP